MIRTCDPLIRSQVLYPAELRVRFMVKAEERIYVRVRVRVKRAYSDETSGSWGLFG